MSAARMTRRGFLASAIGLALAGPLLGACGAPAAPATTVPAPTQAPAATAAPAGGKIPLSVATYAGYVGDYERDFANKWAQQHPEVNLTVDAVPYGDMAKKQLLQIAAGDMEDISFSGIKWYPYTIYKGGFRAIDDYVKTRDPGMDDFLESCLTR